MKTSTLEKPKEKKLALSCSNLTVGYGDFVVQSDLNLELHAGELVCLIGPNGSGKSTLMRTLAGLQKPISGNTLISGKNINLLSQQEKATLISMVLTDRVDVENARVFDIVSLGRYPHTHWWGGVSAEDDKIIRQTIKNGAFGRKNRTFNVATFRWRAATSDDCASLGARYADCFA
jgi:iron complex transport system ATP-binding protein